MRLWPWGFAHLLWIASLPSLTDAADPAAVIYHNGDIVTVDDRNPTAEAVAVQGGKIVAVGKKDEVFKRQGDGAKVIDLHGKTLAPGFVDGHSHFSQALLLPTMANCSSPPVGPVKTNADIVTQLKRLQHQRKIPKGAFIVGYGFDMNLVADKNVLSAADLDPAFPDSPVMVIHVSLHGAVLNSAALKKFQITADTPTPPGGVILRKEGSNEPAGLLMETAFLPIFAKMPAPGAAELLGLIKAAQEIYAAAGVTTMQDGATHLSGLELFQAAAGQHRLYLDLVAYPFVTEAEEVLKKYPPTTFGKYSNHLKLGGIKMVLDGSPQAKTAFFTTPYRTGGPAGEKNWRGEPSFPMAEVERMTRLVYDNHLQLICHCNGDAAIDLLLAAHEAAAKDRTADLRTVAIHSQFVRKDQLEKYVAYKIVPSFYTEHCYFFGDAHVKNRGRQEASFISPMKTALALGLRCANHTDFPVVPIDQLFVLWSAVNRVSRAGEVLGPGERVTPLQALKAITLDGAYMYGEERSKGSIEVGKLADLVILDKNPLKVDPKAIKDIKVLETIKEGVTVYRAKK
jgi:predicted amidohydrolase YtcJ